MTRESQPERGRCRAPECRAEILFVKSRRNRTLVLDVAEREADGKVILFTIDERTGLARLATIGERGRASHFVTCPSAHSFRRGRKA